MENKTAYPSLVSGTNVHQRIHAVMSEMRTVAKNGRNDFHKYDYASEADFVQALRPLLTKWCLVVYPQILSSSREKVGDKGDVLTSLMVKFHVVNTDNPTDKIEVIVEGTGTDKGDKGTYKAMTGAKKYFIAQTFMVATGDDPEDDGPNPNRRPAPPKKGKPSGPLAPSDDF